MATPEHRNEKISEAKKLLESLANISASSLSRKEDLSRDINFSEAVPHFEEMLDIVKQLNQRDISRLSTQQIDKIISTCTQLNSHIEKVKSFDLNQNTPADVCNSIIEQIKNAYDAIMEPLIVPLAFTASQATDYAKIEREAKGYHSTMREEADEFKKVMESYKVEADKALQAVKAQAAEAGVSTNAHIFLNESTLHSQAAKKWLITTIAASAVTFITALIFVIISFKYQPANAVASIQYVVSKLILLSTLSFGIFWASRNYKSSKHNETLNKHRANALMTFKAFVEGSNDIHIKDAVLMQAAQATFVNRQTGYEAIETDIPPINQAIDIISKSATKAGSLN